MRSLTNGSTSTPNSESRLTYNESVIGMGNIDGIEESTSQSAPAIVTFTEP